MALSSTKTTDRKILGVHPWLDSHPGWRARTTSILTYDPRFYERPLVRQVWLIARLARDFDACALFYEARFILPAAFLIRLLSRSRIVSGEVYPKIVSMNKRALLSHFPLFLAYRSLFALADRAIVHSRFEISLYSAFFRVPASRFAFIPFCMDHTIPEADDVDWEERWRTGHVLCPGRRRDLATFIAATKELDRKCIIIAGREDEAALASYTSLPQNLEIHIEVSKERYDSFFENAALVVLPFHASHTLRALGQMAYLEAAWYGIPTVTSRTPHLADYAVEDREVLCYEAGAADDLRGKIERLLRDRESAWNIAQAARGRVTTPTYTRDQYVANVLAEIERAIEPSSAPSPAHDRTLRESVRSSPPR